MTEQTPIQTKEQLDKYIMETEPKVRKLQADMNVLQSFDASAVQKAKTIQRVYAEMLGDANTPGYVPELRAKLEASEEKYTEIHAQTAEFLEQTKKLRDNIEQRLNPQATAIGLSEVFRAKSGEYARARTLLEAALLCLFALGIVGGFAIGSGVFLYTPLSELSTETVLLTYVPYTPSFGIFIWLLIFLGNRRAENKKLEEIYTHKWAMAQSYVGYERSIKEMGGEKSAEFSHRLMSDLLDAIKKDASVFLRTKGEKHPVAELLKPAKPGE